MNVSDSRSTAFNMTRFWNSTGFKISTYVVK